MKFSELIEKNTRHNHEKRKGASLEKITSNLANWGRYSAFDIIFLCS